MTRHRRRKLRGLMKCTAAVILPLFVAAGARGAAYVSRTVTGDGRAVPQRTEGAEAPVKEEKKESRVTFSELPDESVMLSVGYGIEDESGSSELLRLPSPLDINSDDAGAKPYPTHWETGEGEIVRTTYGRYSGSAFFDLEGGGQVNNKTDIPNEELIRESGCLPNFTVEDTDEPLVLI